MARLYAATGDGIVRLDEAGESWTVELALSGSGAQCLAVDSADPDTVYAGLREGGVRRSVDGGYARRLEYRNSRSAVAEKGV
jgi:hypothetical protein